MLAAGLMLSSVTVYASEYSYIEAPEDFNRNDANYSNNGYYHNPTHSAPHFDYYGTEPPSTASTGSWFYHMALDDSGKYTYQGDYQFDGTYWVRDGGAYTWGNAPGGNESNPDSAVKEEDRYMSLEDFIQITTQAEAAANQKAAKDAGFANVTDMDKAAEKNMSAGEYYNNAIINTPNIENAIPVGQGGNLVINGVETNATATLSKADSFYVDSVRSTTEGTLLNVVNVQFPAQEAIINFYMPGIAEGTEITAMQYVNGTWANVMVTEIRADHVVLSLEQNGVIAFIQK